MEKPDLAIENEGTVPNREEKANGAAYRK